MSQTHGTPTGALVSFKVSATITAFNLLKVTGANRVGTWDTTTAIMFAISQDASKGGSDTSVLAQLYGCAKLTAGASVSAGAFITGTTTGLGIEDTSLGLIKTSTASVPFGIGIALDAADTNSTFEVLMMPRSMRWVA